MPLTCSKCDVETYKRRRFKHLQTIHTDEGPPPCTKCKCNCSYLTMNAKITIMIFKWNMLNIIVYYNSVSTITPNLKILNAPKSISLNVICQTFTLLRDT